MAALANKDLKDFFALTKLASSSGAHGGGASAPRSVRLPCCLGSPSSPSKAWWSCSGFRRRVVVRVEDDARVQEDLSQKIVLKLPLDGERNRRKAFKAAVGMAGVTSATMEGDKIIIVGDGMDPIALTTMLRRGLGHAELLSVSSGDDKKRYGYGYGYREENNGYSYGGTGGGGGKDSKGGGGYHQNALAPMPYTAYHQYNAMPSYPAYSYPAPAYQQQE